MSFSSNWYSLITAKIDAAISSVSLLDLLADFFFSILYRSLTVSARKSSSNNSAISSAFEETSRPPILLSIPTGLGYSDSRTPFLVKFYYANSTFLSIGSIFFASNSTSVAIW